VTKIILTRHGHVEGIEPVRFRGRLQLELTDQGRWEARRTRDRINSAWKVAQVYSSPMHRAVETARIIGEPFQLEPTPLELLNDIDYGHWEGLTMREVRSKWPLKLALWKRAPDLAEFPGGETLKQLQARVLAALDAILAAHTGDTAVIVGHDSVNRVLLCHIMELPLSRYWDIGQAPCAIDEIDAVGGRFTVGTINDVRHLADRSAAV
jgi:broad specificity phosphatase PhoE